MITAFFRSNFKTEHYFFAIGLLHLKLHISSFSSTVNPAVIHLFIQSSVSYVITHSNKSTQSPPDINNCRSEKRRSPAFDDPVANDE